MKKWSANFLHDPYDGYNLTLELQYGSDDVAVIKRSQHGLILEWYTSLKDLIVPVDWLLGLLEDAKRRFSGSVFTGQATEDAELNTQQGLRHVNEILNHPQSTHMVRHHARFGQVLDVRMPCGKGARWSADGTRSIALLESLKPNWMAIMKGWTADFANDPDDDSNLIIEILFDDKHVAEIKRSRQGLVLKWLDNPKGLVISVDWLIGLLETARQNISLHD